MMRTNVIGNLVEKPVLNMSPLLGIKQLRRNNKQPQTPVPPKKSVQ